MAVVLRLCKHCRALFKSKTQRALYCSHQCNKEYNRRKKRQMLVPEVAAQTQAECAA